MDEDSLEYPFNMGWTDENILADMDRLNAVVSCQSALAFTEDKQLGNSSDCRSEFKHSFTNNGLCTVFNALSFDETFKHEDNTYLQTFK